jgi:hypothetical protein
MNGMNRFKVSCLGARLLGLFLLFNLMVSAPLSAHDAQIPRVFPDKSCIRELDSFARVIRTGPFDGREYSRRFNEGPEALFEYLLDDPTESVEFAHFFHHMIGGPEQLESMLGDHRLRGVLKVLMLTYKSFSNFSMSMLSEYYEMFPGFFQISNHMGLDWLRYFHTYRFFDAYRIIKIYRSSELAWSSNARPLSVALDLSLLRGPREFYPGGISALEADILQKWPSAYHSLVPIVAAYVGEDLARRTRSRLDLEPAFQQRLNQSDRHKYEALLEMFNAWGDRVGAPTNLVPLKTAQLFFRSPEVFLTADRPYFERLLLSQRLHHKNAFRPHTKVLVKANNTLNFGGTERESATLQVSFDDLAEATYKLNIVYVGK